MTTLTFQNTTLSVINQNNQTFLTGSDLGIALGYSKPLQSVTNLYNSNADEFTAEMTALIEMPTAGGLQKVRIFSLRGAHLIAMFARTKVAKDFRKWVLDILDEEVRKSTALLTPEQQQAIQSAVQQAHHRTGLHWQEIYRQLKAMFHIAKYDQLPQDQFGNAMAFVMNLQPVALLPVEKKFAFEFTEYELQQLVWAWFALLRGTELCQVLHPVLKQIGSHYAASVYSMAYEYRSTLRQAHNVLTRITEQFECEQGNNWRVLKYLRAYNPKATGFQLNIL
ncbi:TPA: P22AR C-terminal domain-containing protein [Haemophilus influenzae]